MAPCPSDERLVNRLTPCDAADATLAREMRRPPRFDHIPADDPRWREGARLFNAGHCFESHEVWEALWHELGGPERDLLKGLIQLAAAYHHLGRGNSNGAQRLYTTARAYVAAWAPRHAGLQLDALLDDVDHDFSPSAQRRMPSRPPTIRFETVTTP